MKKLHITLDISDITNVSEIIESLEMKHGANVIDVKTTDTDNEFIGEYMMLNVSQQYRNGSIINILQVDYEDEEYGQVINQFHKCTKQISTGELHSASPNMFVLNSTNSPDFSEEHGKYSLKPDCLIIPNDNKAWAYNSLMSILVFRYLKNIKVYKTNNGLIGVVHDIELSDIAKMKQIRLTDKVKRITVALKDNTSDAIELIKESLINTDLYNGVERTLRNAVILINNYITEESVSDRNIIEVSKLIGETIKRLAPYHNIHDMILHSDDRDNMLMWFNVLDGMGLMSDDDRELFNNVDFDIDLGTNIEYSLLTNKILNIGDPYLTIFDISTAFYTYKCTEPSQYVLDTLRDTLINALTYCNGDELYEYIEEVNITYPNDFKVMKKVMFDFAEGNIVSSRGNGFMSRELMVKLIKLDGFIKDLDRSKYPNLRRFIMENKLSR